MICSSRRVLYVFLLVDGGFGATMRRVAAAGAVGSGDSPGSDAARRLRDCLGGGTTAAAAALESAEC